LIQISRLIHERSRGAHYSVGPRAATSSICKPGDAGADILSRIDITLAPGERALVPTGIAIALPDGYVALVHPRSGLAIKHGVTMVNSPGTVDAAYRGELQIILINHDPKEDVTFKRGDRIAQLVIQKVEHAKFIEVSQLPGSDRGSGGFGSTGVKP
jgi:dUTP pyrophosphatase